MSKTLKITLFSFAMLLIFSVIASAFWVQELQYITPTEVPEDYQLVTFGEDIDLEGLVEYSSDRPLFLHFYQKSCPCSRFNISEFRRISEKYGDDVDFRVVLQDPGKSSVERFIEKHELDVPVLHDPDGIISDACGVYSTPQAAIIKTDGTLFYRGNYNKARYCTNLSSAFADVALEALIAEEPLPAFSSFATTAYGCNLPSDSVEKLSFFENIF